MRNDHETVSRQLLAAKGKIKERFGNFRGEIFCRKLGKAVKNFLLKILVGNAVKIGNDEKSGEKFEEKLEKIARNFSGQGRGQRGTFRGKVVVEQKLFEGNI